MTCKHKLVRLTILFIFCATLFPFFLFYLNLFPLFAYDAKDRELYVGISYLKLYGHTKFYRENFDKYNHFISKQEESIDYNDGLGVYFLFDIVDKLRIGGAWSYYSYNTEIFYNGIDSIHKTNTYVTTVQNTNIKTKFDGAYLAHSIFEYDIYRGERLGIFISWGLGIANHYTITDLTHKSIATNRTPEQTKDLKVKDKLFHVPLASTRRLTQGEYKDICNNKKNIPSNAKNFTINDSRVRQVEDKAICSLNGTWKEETPESEKKIPREKKETRKDKAVGMVFSLGMGGYYNISEQLQLVLGTNYAYVGGLKITTEFGADIIKQELKGSNIASFSFALRYIL